MKHLLLLLFVLSAFGQDVVPNRRRDFTLLSTFTPRSEGSIRYWWVASDNPLNVNVSNWVDRIQGLVLSNSNNALRPTNSSTGVGFNGSTWLTNGVGPFISLGGSSSPTGAVWVVFSPVMPSTTDGGLMAGTDGHGLFTGNANTLLFFGNAGNGTISSFISGNTYDLAMIKTNANADLACYTNNVARPPFVAGDFGAGGFTYLGLDVADSFFYKGKVLEVAFFYSNITTTVISNLHRYATNTYGYSP